MTKSDLAEQLENLLTVEEEDLRGRIRKLIDQFIESERAYFDQEYKHMTRKIKDYVESELDSFPDDFSFGVE